MSEGNLAKSRSGGRKLLYWLKRKSGALGSSWLKLIWSHNPFQESLESKGLLTVPFSSPFYSRYGCKLVTQESCAYVEHRR